MHLEVQCVLHGMHTFDSSGSINRNIQGTNVQDIIYNNYLEKSNFSRLMVIFLIFNKRDLTV